VVLAASQVEDEGEEVKLLFRILYTEIFFRHEDIRHLAIGVNLRFNPKGMGDNSPDIYVGENDKTKHFLSASRQIIENKKSHFLIILNDFSRPPCGLMIFFLIQFPDLKVGAIFECPFGT